MALERERRRKGLYAQTMEDVAAEALLRLEGLPEAPSPGQRYRANTNAVTTLLEQMAKEPVPQPAMQPVLK